MPEPITPPAETPAAGAQGGQQGGEQGNENQPQTFTQEQVDKMITDRLDRANKSFEKKLNEAVTKTKSEVESTLKLSDEQRQEAQRQKDEEERQAKDRDLTLRENRLYAREQLVENELDTDLIDFVVDLEQENIDTKVVDLKKIWDKALAAKVQESLKGKTPTAPTKSSDKDTEQKKGSFYM